MQTRQSRWKIALPLLSVLLLAGLWSAFWWIAKEGARNEFERRTAGGPGEPSLECSEQSWGGYPFRIALDCFRPLFRFADGSSLKATALNVIAQAYNINHVLISLHGPSSYETTDGIVADITHETLRNSVRTRDGNVIATSSETSNVKLSINDEQVLKASYVNLHWRTPEPDKGKAIDTVDLVGEIRHLSDPAFNLGTLTYNGQITSPPSFSDKVTKTLKHAANRNSKLDVRLLSLTGGDLPLEASGTASITNTGYIEGRFTTKTNGLDQTLAALMKLNLIPPEQASEAKALAGMIKIRDGLALELRFNDRKIYWGPVKLGNQTPLF